MIDIAFSPEVITIFMFGALLIGVITGFPLALPIGGVGVITGYLLFGPNAFDIIYSRVSVSYTHLTLPTTPYV